MPKPNPILTAFEKKLRAEFALEKAQMKADHSAEIARLSELDLMAHIIAGNEDFNIGPGRARKCVDGYLETKLDIATAVVEEAESDEQGEIVKTKYDLAKRIKQIVGPEFFEELKPSFPMLWEVWDLV